MGNCQNYGPFLGPYYNTGPNLGDPKRDHNFDNPPHNPADPQMLQVLCAAGMEMEASQPSRISDKHPRNPLTSFMFSRVYDGPEYVKISK